SSNNKNTITSEQKVNNWADKVEVEILDKGKNKQIDYAEASSSKNNESSTSSPEKETTKQYVNYNINKSHVREPISSSAETITKTKPLDFTDSLETN
ncbi:3123_t:CDS:1, partial [Scutellospora calospora]